MKHYSKTEKYLKVLLAVTVIYFLSAVICVKPSTISVGHFAGECTGKCNVTYTITSDHLEINEWENDSNKKDQKIIPGDFQYLNFRVPLIILTHVSGTFGCPDCSDGGAYSLGFKLMGINFTYTLDPGQDPWYFNDMTSTIKDRLRKIGELETPKK